MYVCVVLCSLFCFFDCFCCILVLLAYSFCSRVRSARVLVMSACSFRRCSYFACVLVLFVCLFVPLACCVLVLIAFSFRSRVRSASVLVLSAWCSFCLRARFARAWSFPSRARFTGVPILLACSFCSRTRSARVLRLCAHFARAHAVHIHIHTCTCT